MQTKYSWEAVYSNPQGGQIAIPLSGDTAIARKWEAFPKEAIADFNTNLNVLALKITDVAQEVKNIKPSFATNISDLNNEKYSLNCPIAVIINKENDDFFCECVDHNIFGVGETEKDAIEDLKKMIVKYFESLNNPKEKLSKRLILKLRLLKKHINCNEVQRS